MEFVGRKAELSLLRREPPNGQRSVLSAIYGRRRVGKTTLVEQAFVGRPFYKFEGLEGEPEAKQRRHFRAELYRISGQDEHRVASTDNWVDLLILLSRFLADQPCAVLFDEFQWMAAEKHGLVSALKYVWDNHVIKHNRCHLVVCGSVSSFIVKQVLQSRALYGRVDNEVNLQPFSLPATIRDYFNVTDGRQVLDYYLAVGGVPRYLQLYDKSKSSRQNIEQQFFRSSGYLFRELQRLFVSHFGRVAHYRTIVNFLANRPNATKPQIERHCGLSSGGRIAELLEELVLAGFAERYPSIHNASSTHLARYRIKDPYLRFYFRFVAGNAVRIEQQTEAMPLHMLLSEQSYRTWRGLAFEQCVREHSPLVAKALGFSAVRYDAGALYKKSDQSSGFQVDLLFRRADDVVTLCEIKYRDRLGNEVVSELEAKVAKVMEQLAPYSVHKVLITATNPPKSLKDSGAFDDILTFDEVFQAANRGLRP